jgi:hypothetical protein
MSDARAITKELRGRWLGSYGVVRCPAHDDREPSLSIRDGKDELIVNCFAGCDWRDVKSEFRRLGLLDEKIEPRRVEARAVGTIVPREIADACDLQTRIDKACPGGKLPE